jgi:hypothetical protein
MFVHISEERQVVGSLEVNYRCPSCQAVQQTDAFRFKTVDKLYGLIPIWVVSETIVKCPSCYATQSSSAALEGLSVLTPDQLGLRFRVRVGLIEKFLMVAGWLLIIITPFSLALFIMAWLRFPKAARGWRGATLAGIVVAIIISAIFSVLIIDEWIRKGN